MFLQDVLRSLGPDDNKTKEDIIRERNEYIRQTIDVLGELYVARTRIDEEFSRRVNSEAELHLKINELQEKINNALDNKNPY